MRSLGIRRVIVKYFARKGSIEMANNHVVTDGGDALSVGGLNQIEDTRQCPRQYLTIC